MNLMVTTLAAYLLGAVPVGVLVGYVVLRRDIRTGGSGHSGATNTIRQAGWPAGVAVAALDVAKGAAAVGLAYAWGDAVWAPALAAGAAVAGHCWPIFAGFRGGMGVATAGGALLAAYPLGVAGGLGLLLAAAFIFRHSARSSFTAGLLLPLAVYALSGSLDLAGLAGAAGLMAASRALFDWNHQRGRGVWVTKLP